MSAQGTSVVDLSSVFEKYANRIGVLDEELVIMKQKGWNTYGGFAHCCPYRENDESGLIKQVAKITGTGSSGEIDDARMTIFRRLYTESFVMATSESTARATRKEGDAPMRLPLVELTRRDEAL